MGLTTAIRPDPEAGEVREVRDHREDADEEHEDERGRRHRKDVDALDRDKDQDDQEADGLRPDDDDEAPEPPTGDRGDDIHRAPGDGRAESGQEADGHVRRSLRAGPWAPGGGAVPCYTPRRPERPPRASASFCGDVAQLGEHRVRIAGVRGSSPHLHHRTAEDGDELFSMHRAAGRLRGSVGQVVSPRVCKTLAYGCGGSIPPRPTMHLIKQRNAGARWDAGV